MGVACVLNIAKRGFFMNAGETGFEDDLIIVTLGRILASEEFKNSPQLQNFLKFIVDESLAGRGDRLNAYAIATTALKRSKDFNPEVDSIVRTLAVRLRRSLDHYSMTVGKTDRYRVAIPKGSYIPQFELNDQQQPTASKSELLFQFGRTKLVAAALVILALSQFTHLAVDSWDRYNSMPQDQGSLQTGALEVPVIEISQFRRGVGWEQAGSFESSGLAEAMSSEISNRFFKFRRVRVLNRLPGKRRHVVGYSSNPSGPLYQLRGLVNRWPEALQFNVILVRFETMEKVWSKSYDINIDGKLTRAQQEDLASKIVTAIAQPDGMLDRLAGSQLTTGSVQNNSNERCIRRAYGYWQYLPPDELSKLRTCLEYAVKGKHARDAAAWAALSLIYVDLYRTKVRDAEGNLDDLLDSAASAADRAHELDPTSEAALRSLYSISFVRGDMEQFKRIGRRAVETNPLNANTLADFGRKLGYSGDWEEGVALSKRAMELHPNSPDWYKLVIIHNHYRKKEYREALNLSLSLKSEKLCGTHFARALNSSALGEMERAKASVEYIKKAYPNFPHQAMQLFKLWNFEPDMISRFKVDLGNAGMKLTDEPMG